MRIPKQFLRTKTGTDIIIVGFPRQQSWQKDLVYSVLENFWPAIELVRSRRDSPAMKQFQPTIWATMLTRFSGEEGFSAHQYYNAFKNPSMTFSRKPRHLKAVTLYLTSDENDLPEKGRHDPKTRYGCLYQEISIRRSLLWGLHLQKRGWQ